MTMIDVGDPTESGRWAVRLSGLNERSDTTFSGWLQVTKNDDRALSRHFWCLTLQNENATIFTDFDRARRWSALAMRWYVRRREIRNPRSYLVPA